MYPDRIVIGGIDSKSLDCLAKLYEGFAGVEVIRTNNSTAELIKYTSNSLLALLISFSNEVGNLCAALGDTDVVDVMQGVHASRYLTTVLSNGEQIVPPITSFLAAGCGFGGSCLPKDVKALIAHGEKHGVPMPLLDAVIETNLKQPQKMLDLLKKHFPSLDGIRVAVLGLAFRPDTNDMRESPAIPIIQELVSQGAVVNAYDPVATHEAEKIFSPGMLTFSSSLPQALEEAQAVLLVTRWDEFRSVPDLLAKLDPQPVLIDGRRFLDKHQVAKYEGIGL
jgi:UDPglucose 6-dehydrogenase/GDP-mannose 6-dehydrogenase